MSSPPLSFTNQDLRRRSFRHQKLQRARFDHCDLRGCDFYRADLRGAQFSHCRVGPRPLQWAIAIILILPLAALLFHAVSSLIFAAMGTLPGQTAWSYILALYGALALATIGTGLRTATRSAWLMLLGRALTGTAIAALLGFFYGGRLTDNNVTFAVLGAAGLGVFGLLAAIRLRTMLMQAGWSILGAIAAYGLAFLLWTNGSSLLTTGQWFEGIVWCLGSGGCILITLSNLTHAGRWLRRSTTTSFWRANLIGCKFIETDVTHCDLTNAVRRP